MKILHVINSMDPAGGGPCQGIRNMDTSMRRMRIEREVVCLDDPTALFLTKDSFLIHALGAGKGYWKYHSQLVSWLNKNLARFDIVVVNGLWLYHSYATIKALDQLKKLQEANTLPRVFIMPHGMLDPYFQRVPERKLKAFRNWVYWKLIENKVISKAEGLLFTCETELVLARKSFQPYQPHREINVGYGVQEPPTFDSSMKDAFHIHCSQLGNVPYWIFLSRIHPKKGVNLLIHAYAALLKKTIGLPKLVIAGPGLETTYGKLMQRLAFEKYQLQEEVYFTGMLTGDAKWGAFYGCEAFVLPSHQENFGIAVVEAMACGRPVLISNQVNIWREIETSGGGMVAEDTIVGTQVMLERWLNLPNERKQQMGRQARKVYTDNFDIDAATQKFVKALLEK